MALLPIALNPWVLSKEAVLAAGAAVASRASASGRLPRWSVFVTLGAVVVLVTAALNSSAPLVQLMGRFPRYEGVISLVVYFLALWTGARLLGGDPGVRRIAVFSRTLAGVSIAIAAVSLAQLTGFSFGGQQFARPGSLLGNATDQGIVGGMMVCFLAVRVAREWRWSGPVAGKRGAAKTKLSVANARPFPWLELGGAAAGAVTLAVSASRGALLGTGLALLLWIMVEGLRERGFPRVAIGASAAAVAVFGLATLVAPLVISRVAGTSPLAAATIQDRFAMAHDAISLLLAHPVLGVGPGGFVDAVPSVQGSAWFALAGSSSGLDSPHNWILQAAMAGGIPLAALALALAAISAVVAVRRWRSARGERLADYRIGAALAVVVFGVTLLTHFTIASTTILAAFLLGSVVAVPAESSARRVVGWARTTLLAVVTGALVILAAAEIPLASGVGAAAAGDVAGARADFDLATSIRPWDAEAFSIAAQSAAAAADKKVTDAAPLAERYARDALGLAPDSSESRLALAVALTSAGHLSAAKAQLEILNRRTPDNLRVLIRLADVASRQGDDARVKELLSRAQTVNPTDPDVRDAVRQLEK